MTFYEQNRKIVPTIEKKIRKTLRTMEVVVQKAQKRKGKRRSDDGCDFDSTDELEECGARDKQPQKGKSKKVKGYLSHRRKEVSLLN